MKTSDYWKKRFEQLEQTTNDMSREYCREVDKSFRRSIATVESDLEKWYNRLAVNNEVSLLRAKQMLNDKELQEFKWTVEEYVKYGEKNSITQEWLKELENASSKAHIERLESIKIQLQNQVEVAYGSLEDGLSTTLGKIYENSYYKTGYEIQKGLNVGSSMAAIDNDKIGKAIKRPWATDNNNFSSRIWKNKQQLINNLNTNLTQSIIRGEDPQRAINNISRIMNTSKSNVGRLVMTESAFISSSAQKDCFNELDVEQYEIVATLDTKTSEICRELDGKVFDMKDYQPGVTAPPFHCWCRTTTCPYFDDEFTQGEERAYRDVDCKTQYVEDMDYDEWYKKYVSNDEKYKYKETAEKNRASDKQQYESYVDVLGKENVPKNLNEFQDIKYSNSDEYDIMKAQVKGMSYYNKAVDNEPLITSTIKGVAQNNNVDILGLEYRLKTKDSYIGKIRRDYADGNKGFEINDIIRYTYGTDSTSLADKTLSCIDNLENMGYNTVKVKNSWLDKNNPYNGINTTVKAPNGQKFEIQYHTQESFDLKNGKMHELYEKQRVITDKRSVEYIRLQDEMFDLSDALRKPKDVERVKSHG